MTDRDKLPAKTPSLHLVLPKEQPGSLVARGLDALKKKPETDPAKLFRDAVDAYARADFAEAVKWLRQAADQGFAPAQGSLGVMYDQKRGIRVWPLRNSILGSCTTRAGVYRRTMRLP
jgi:hypothetical protein